MLGAGTGRRLRPACRAVSRRPTVASATCGGPRNVDGHGPACGPYRTPVALVTQLDRSRATGPVLPDARRPEALRVSLSELTIGAAMEVLGGEYYGGILRGIERVVSRKVSARGFSKGFPHPWGAAVGSLLPGHDPVRKG
jgi:hypothetical protein